VLVDGVILVVVAASLIGAIVLRRRSHDDDHSVEGYHRQIHTLEVINEHPPGTEGETEAVEAHKHSYPESAVRLTESATVRLSESPPETVPPPDVTERVGAITFDDATAKAAAADPNKKPGWDKDPAIGFMNHRPRRLLAPGLAVVSVLVLVVILLIFGSHNNLPKHRQSAGNTTRTSTTKGHVTATTVAPTTVPLPIVSAPQATTATDDTYEVGKSTFTLVISATSESCWVSVTGPTGSNIFTGVLAAGQNQTVPATGLVSVEVGAPMAFAATINGTAVQLPTSYQTPLNLHFTPAASAA
jgi:hypothetical protein